MAPGAVLLVVTKDPLYRAYFSGEQAGWTVHLAPTAGSALDLLFDRRPDVLLLDLDGCEIPGSDLLRTAKRVCRNLAVVILSPVPSVEADAGILEEGVLFYTAKPRDPAELEPALAAAFASVDARADRARAADRLGAGRLGKEDR
jgi:DNA-binding response OmpR family regulator